MIIWLKVRNCRRVGAHNDNIVPLIAQNLNDHLAMVLNYASGHNSTTMSYYLMGWITSIHVLKQTKELTNVV